MIHPLLSCLRTTIEGDFSLNFVKNLKIIKLPFKYISENGFLNYIIELNNKFAFIVNDLLDKNMWKKLILSNNYIIGLYNSNNAKFYSKLIEYIMQEEEFLIVDDGIPF